MDLVNSILNIVLPPFVFLSLLLLSPLILFFKLFNFVKRRVNAENVAGKVVVITGAASGIGEGARLTLVDRREDRLPAVAEKSRRLGSGDVVVLGGDVTVLEDCKRFVEETIDHFGQLDHLVNNAGITDVKVFKNYSRISDAMRLMDTNFCGAINITHFAIPHLKKSKGKIIAMASASGWFPTPKISIYGASKAAMINFYETLRIELGPEIGVTIVAPGFVRTEMATPEILAKEGWGFIPLIPATRCAREIVKKVCRHERFVTEPSWVRVLFWVQTLCPDFLVWALRASMKSASKHH